MSASDFCFPSTALTTFRTAIRARGTGSMLISTSTPRIASGGSGDGADRGVFAGAGMAEGSQVAGSSTPLQDAKCGLDALGARG